MNTKQKEAVLDVIKSIKPGENYPSFVLIEAKVKGQKLKLKFLLNSFYVGMYCAIYINDAVVPQQTGGYDNKKFVRGLKRDITKAVERGAKVTIGQMRSVKKTMD